MQKSKLLFAAGVALAVLVAWTGCDLAGGALDGAAQARGYLPAGSVAVIEPTDTFTLWAGKTIPVGSVRAAFVGDSLQIVYETSGEWLLEQVHVYVQEEPFTERLSPGLTPYKAEDLGGVSSHTLEVPLADLADEGESLCGKTFWVQAHAAVVRVVDGLVVQEETAYGGEVTDPDQGSWYGQFSFTITCEEPPPEYRYETAWAFGGIPFNSYIKRAAWGWVIEAGADGEAELWAAAGQNDLSKGTLVGAVRWQLEGGSLSVTYDLDEGFVMSEAHLYVGAERPAKAAPGQLGCNAGELDDVSGYTFTVEGVGYPLYLAAHAVVGWLE